MNGIFNAVLAGYTCSLEVCCVDLKSWLICEYLKENSCVWRVEAGSNTLVITLAVLVCVEAPVVVKTIGVLNLMEGCVANTFVERTLLVEIHGSAINVANLARCHVCTVRRGEFVSVYIENHVCTGLAGIA